MSNPSPSFIRLVWQQFLEHRAAVAGLIVVSLFALLGLLAPMIAWLCDLNPDKQNALKRYLPPASYSELSSSEKENLVLTLESFNLDLLHQINQELHQLDETLYSPEQDAAYIWLDQNYEDRQNSLAKLKPTPSLQQLKQWQTQSRSWHFLGTDELGRDVWIRLLYGTRISLGVGLLVALASAIIGLFIGALAGYYGGWLDHALMRLTDSLLSLPLMPVLIVLSAVKLSKVPVLGAFVGGNNESLIKLVFILVLFSWMTVARLVRAEVLSLREREYILAARTMGARDLFIIIRHLLPNVLAPLLVSVTLGIGESIQFEAALSFLGLGIQQPTPSWGNMLMNAQELITEAPFLAFVPGLCILLITISFNYMGDGLQDAVNPKSIRR